MKIKYHYHYLKLMKRILIFKIKRDIENAETIIWGLGETHLEVIASRIKNKFGADVILQDTKGSI